MAESNMTDTSDATEKRQQSVLSIICLVAAALFLALVAYNLFAAGAVIAPNSSLAGVALPLALFAIGALAGPESANSAAMPPHGVRIKIRQTIARCILSNDLLSPEDHVHLIECRVDSLSNRLIRLQNAVPTLVIGT